MFCNVTETLYVSHADFKRFVTFCKRLSSDSAVTPDRCYICFPVFYVAENVDPIAIDKR